MLTISNLGNEGLSLWRTEDGYGLRCGCERVTFEEARERLADPAAIWPERAAAWRDAAAARWRAVGVSVDVGGDPMSDQELHDLYMSIQNNVGSVGGANWVKAVRRDAELIYAAIRPEGTELNFWPSSIEAALRLRAERDRAGLSVVATGEPPPWMEPVRYLCAACGGAGRIYTADEAGEPCGVCQEDGVVHGDLYRLTEGSDR